jgi:hypothetical protein
MVHAPTTPIKFPFSRNLPRCSDTVHRSSVSNLVDGLSTPVDPTPGNGAFRLSPDFRADGAGAHSRVLRRRVEANPPAEELVPESHDGNEAATGAWFPGTIGGAPGGRPAIGTFHLARQSGEWRLPPIHGFPGQWRWRQFPVVAPLNPGKSFGSKQWRRDQMTAIMPASGGWFRTRWVPHQAADVQLARSTYMTLAGQSHLRHRFTWMKEQGVA